MSTARNAKTGLQPGSLIYVGDSTTKAVKARMFDYNEEWLEERALASLDECLHLEREGTRSWLDIDGVHEVDFVRRIGEAYGIHALTLEDITNTDQRPKFEEYPHYVYIVLKMLHYDHQACALDVEQVSLIIKDNLLISFQESIEDDVFEPVRTRLREGMGRVRQAGVDYLAYELMDLIVDHYLDVLEGIGEHIENFEDRLTGNFKPSIVREINRLRRHVIFLRRSIWPLRDVISNLERSNKPFLHEENAYYLRDVYDHTVRTMEIMESSRELLASMIELYMSSLSFRSNEVMKILAIISTIFLPLSFVAGLYGMNFNTQASPLNMPELNWRFGYPFALGIMATMTAFMLLFFKRKGWF